MKQNIALSFCEQVLLQHLVDDLFAGKNNGATVKTLSVTAPPGISIGISPMDIFVGGNSGHLNITGASDYPFSFDINFTDMRGENRAVTYEMVSQYAFVECPG